MFFAELAERFRVSLSGAGFATQDMKIYFVVVY